MEIEFSRKALSDSPFDLIKLVFPARRLTMSIPFSKSTLEISVLGTPSKTSKNDSSSSFFKSSAVDFPKRILEAF